MKHIYTSCGKSVEVVNKTVGVANIYHCALKVKVQWLLYASSGLTLKALYSDYLHS
jgi:hypothetical protein